MSRAIRLQQHITSIRIVMTDDHDHDITFAPDPGFNQTFPGVRVHLLGHNAIFRIPLFRVPRGDVRIFGLSRVTWGRKIGAPCLKCI